MKIFKKPKNLIYVSYLILFIFLIIVIVFAFTEVIVSEGLSINKSEVSSAHLVETIREFPNSLIIMDKIKKADWKSITIQSMTLGACVIYYAVKF